MAKMVTRTVTETKIKAVVLVYDKESGKTEANPIEMRVPCKVATDKLAFRLLTQNFGVAPYAGIQLDVEEKTIGMPLDDFIKHAVEITRAPSQTKTKEQ